MGRAALAYSNQFHSLNGTKWRIDILIDNYEGAVQYLPLCADAGAVIEWAESDHIGVVQSSRLTLRCVSETDRTIFNTLIAADGYKTAVVYMNGKVYWRGTLDEEIYEEPYSYSWNYEVEFTFSDFGILNLVPYVDDHAFLTVRRVVELALQEAGLESLPIRTHTAFYNPKNHLPLDFNTVSIMPRRLTDEEEEGSFEGTTWRDLLEEVLRPFALRIVQRGGIIWLYDIDSLYDYPSVNQIKWHDEDGWLETSKKAGSVKITFSPSACREIMDGTLQQEWFNLVWGDRYVNLYTIEPIFENGQFVGFEYVEGFKIQHSRFLDHSGRGNIELAHPATAFFRMRPLCEGEECAGVAWNYVCADSMNAYVEKHMLNNPLHSLLETAELFRTKPAFFPHCSLSDHENYCIRLSMDILVDTRCDPFSKEPEEGDSQYFAFNFVQEKFHYVHVPVILNLLDESGNAIWHYENIVNAGSWIHDKARCCWKPGPGKWLQMYLCYYDDDRKNKSPLCHGWIGNRMMIDGYEGDLPPMWDIAEHGEYIPLPPRGGFLQLIVGSSLSIPPAISNPVGPHQHQYNSFINQKPSPFKFHLYRSPKLTLVPAGWDGDIKTENVINKDWWGRYSGVSIETKFGTKTPDVAPTATGLVISGMGPAERFYKNGSPQTLESHLRYLIAAQYWHAAGVVLSGTTERLAKFGPYVDVTTKYPMMMVSDRQNLAEDTSNVRLAQIWPARQLYSFAWSDDVCVLEREKYFFTWSDDVCVKFDDTPLQYMFAWSDDICVKEQNTTSDTYNFAWSDDVCVKAQNAISYNFAWGTYICAVDRMGANTGKKRARFITITPAGGSSQIHGIEAAFTDPKSGTSYPKISGNGKVNLSNLSILSYASRLNAFANYVYSLHSGLQASCPNITTNAELTDTNMCPINKTNLKIN